MSSSDYTILRRLRRTVGNLPHNSCQNYLDNSKMNQIQCMYNSSTDIKPGLSVYDVVQKTDFTDCLSSHTYSYSAAINPIVTKIPIISTPVYVKNRTIVRKCCYKHPSIRVGCSNPVLRRVCKTDDTVRKNI